MIRRRLRALALVVAAVAAGAARGADAPRVKAEILPQGRITDTTQVRLVVTVDGESSVDISTPSLPAMKNLRVVSGPFTQRQSSMSIVNGVFTNESSVSLTYILLPQGAGPAEIPPFDIQVAKTSYRTQALTFKVEAGGGGPRPPAAGSSGRRIPQGEGDDASVDVFLESRLSATSAWVGQPVLFETTLYAAARVTEFGWIEEPTIRGAWVDSPQIDPAHEGARVERGGRIYLAIPVARKVVVPTASGSIAIPPSVANIQVERPARDRFGSFFGLDPVINLVRRSASLTLQVRPLPEAGKTPDFQGAVGSFRITTSCDRRNAQVGDAIAVRATIEGQGSLQAVPPPSLTAPPEVKVFDPKVVINEATGANHLSSRKTWEWVIVPLTPGSVSLPPVSFSYFDAESGTYRNAQGELPAITVVRGTGAVDTGIARGEVQPNVRDIAFIKIRRGPLRESAAPLTRRPWFLALFALPLVATPIGIWAGRRRLRLRTDHGFARGRRAARVAGKRLAHAAARSADPVAFHEAIARALVEYVADRANRPAAGLTYDELDAILEAKGVAPELRRRYRVCLENCDFARFVPDSHRAGGRGEAASEARGIVAALEAVS